MSSAYDHEPKNSGKYLKINPGETATIRIIGEPIIFEKDFNNETSERAGFRVLLKTDEGWVPKALEASVPIFNGIKALSRDEDWGDPEGYSIKIKREGTGLQTKWSVLPGKMSPLTAEMQEIMEEFGTPRSLFISDDVAKILYEPGKGDDHPASVGAGRPRDPEPISTEDLFEDE